MKRAGAADRIDVKRCGDRLELVIGGISYSSFHPERPWTGYVWDALAASVALVEARAPRVLLLGCGAGTALVLLARLRPDARLTAVELDERVLAVSRRRFRLDSLGAELVVADGLEYLARTRRSFDLVIDDMYGPGPDGLLRPVPDEEQHLRLIARRLAPGGVAATNATTDDDPPGLLRAVRAAYRAVFPQRASLAPRRGFNLVLAGSARPLASRALLRLADTLDAEDARELGTVRVRRG